MQPKVEIMMATAMIASARAAEHHLHRRRGHAVVRRVLDLFQRQHAEVSHVGEQVERDDQAGAEGERQRQVAARVLSLRRP